MYIGKMLFCANESFMKLLIVVMSLGSGTSCRALWRYHSNKAQTQSGLGKFHNKPYQTQVKQQAFPKKSY